MNVTKYNAFQIREHILPSFQRKTILICIHYCMYKITVRKTIYRHFTPCTNGWYHGILSLTYALLCLIGKKIWIVRYPLKVYSWFIAHNIFFVYTEFDFAYITDTKVCTKYVCSWHCNYFLSQFRLYGEGVRWPYFTKLTVNDKSYILKSGFNEAW